MRHDDLSVRPILWTGASLAAMVLAVVGIAFALLHHWRLPMGGASEGAHPEPSSISPALETAPQPDKAQYLHEKRAWLDTAAWVDQSRSIARIPLSEAMRLVASGDMPLPGREAPSVAAHQGAHSKGRDESQGDKTNKGDRAP